MNFRLMVLCTMIPAWFTTQIIALGNDTDLQALLELKSTVSDDPFRAMAEWNDSVSHCQWKGLTCDPESQRVTVINLLGFQLVAALPPSIGNMTFLTAINLRNNSFRGEIPPEIGRLKFLRQLNLTYNSFTGTIPENLTHCAELRVLDLVYNNLVGTIPNQLSLLTELTFFGFAGNFFTGEGLPAWIGNFTSLRIITLALNQFSGSIPPEIGRLSNLRIFQIYGNLFSGEIPPGIYNLSDIYYFSVTQNQLHGQLPPDLGFTLPNLEIFAGGVNNFTGRIPVSLPNATKLTVVDFAQNGLTGIIPAGLGNLQSLSRFNFDDNKLGDLDESDSDLEFISSLANCTNLQVLGLSGNNFGGKLPNSVGNLSVNLVILTLGSNFFHGSIPPTIGNLISLSSLGLEGNSFSGEIPDSIGKLNGLQGLHLNYNNFSGKIPPSIGNLTSLSRLFMENNRLEGSFPAELGKLRGLQVINLTGNSLTGVLPREVSGLSSLSISLSISGNFLNGPLPAELGKLVGLSEMDFSRNNFSGEIPRSLSSCLSLERLLLNQNMLTGTVPESLKALGALTEIDLSHNNLSGEIPAFLSKMPSLRKVNLSFNHFSGKVPTQGIFSNSSEISLLGNDRLCGGIPDLSLPSCLESETRSNPKSSHLKVLIPVVVGIVFLFCALGAYVYLKGSRKESPAPESTFGDGELGISYQEISRSTDGFSDENLLGSGSFGSVYKGALDADGGLMVAVKVLNLHQKGASKSFMDECRVLRNTKHRNLLKVVTACSSLDPQGRDFKCIVLEFMENGSLDQWLHPKSGLSLGLRLTIAMDVASALDYLHNYSGKPIVHCDLKPSNVLLDEDMTAHVGDFGLATFLLDSPVQKRDITARLKGSIGYIPPEYGSGGAVSTNGDVYSYGILLLELFTGKRPTDEMFKDGLDIHRFVELALPGQIMDIIDPSMLSVKGKEIEDKGEESLINNDFLQKGNARGMEECLVSVMKTGLACSSYLPGNRMPMSVVVNKMQDIKDSYFGF